MDDKKKIVLGSEDFIAKGIDDIFINVNLQQTFNQIKKDKYDNNFDLAEQFRKERNESRSFRVYGILDSNIIDTDNTDIKIYKDSGLTASQYMGTITTTPLAYSEKNVFNKKRGKYLLELDNYDADVVYMQIIGDNISYGDQVFSQRLVYYNLEGEFVEYGTETIDIGLTNSGFLSIENNFPFFYNKHWIKKDIDIEEERFTIMQFRTQASTVSEGNSISFDIIMDKPSPFGNEIVTLDAVLGTVSPGDYSVSISGNPINFPINLSWNQGEQNKTITFDAITDVVYEFSENISFSLSNFQFTTSGETTEHYVTIEDATPRKITRYNFGEIYKNRLEFTGRTAYNSFNVLNTSAYSILRNGLKYDGRNEEYYPGDTFNVVVTNRGYDTILPSNPDFGINGESIWIANASKTFAVDTVYDGAEKHKVQIIFPSTNYNNGQLRINGVGIPLNSGRLNFTSVSQRILDTSSSDWITSQGYEKDFSAVANGTTGITITSKSTGIPVKVDIIPTSFGTSFPAQPPNPIYTPYIVEIEPFVERNQIPKTLILYANDNNNNGTKYEFQFQKPGYGGVSISAKTHVATTSGVDRFLVTSFEKIARNWNGSQYMSTLGSDCIYSTIAMPEIGQYVTTELGNGVPYAAPSTNSGDGNYYYPVGVAHINGSVFTTQNNSINNGKQNFTAFRTADFKNYPLAVIPCTNALTNIQNIAQKVKITIPQMATGNGTLGQLYAANADSHRSFDYRTGTTGPFTTIYHSNPTWANVPGYKFNWAGSVKASGGTVVANSALGNILNYGNFGVPIGPFLGLDITDEHVLMPYETDSVFYLESKVPGVPFIINNIVEAYVHTTASNFYQQSVTAGDYSAGAPITVELITANAIAGNGLNQANNWMNGYNVDLVLNTGNNSPSSPSPGPVSPVFTL